MIKWDGRLLPIFAHSAQGKRAAQAAVTKEGI